MNVTLQISLTPADIPHAALILPHQLRIWAPQCAETLLVWDLDPGPRYQHQALYRQYWNTCLASLPELNHALRQDWPGLRILTVEADENKRHDLSAQFFVPGSGPLPAKDYRGGPFIAYFYALAAAHHDLVLHFDADIMFGGQSRTWVTEACTALMADAGLLCIAPPGGPPPQAEEIEFTPFFTTRSFLLDRRQLNQALVLSHRDPATLGPVIDKTGTLLSSNAANQTAPTQWLKSFAKPYAELPENLLSEWMQQRQLERRNLVGIGPGMWSLHPPLPSQKIFLPLLPQILTALDQNALPSVQLGEYNLLAATLEALAKA